MCVNERDCGIVDHAAEFRCERRSVHGISRGGVYHGAGSVGVMIVIVEMIMMQLVSIFVNCMRWKVDELLPPQNIMVCAIKS